MTLLQFARGPALEAALIIFVVGVLWRLIGNLALRYKAEHSAPRDNHSLWLGALYAIVRRLWPHRAFQGRVLFSHVMGYVFHIGLAVVVFGFRPHILFIRDLTGLSWPALPNDVIFLVGALTLAALVALLVRRLMNPVLRLISTPDDYISWLITVLPVLTGLMAAAGIGPRYETILAWHILSVELLLIWLPLGKLMHTFTFLFSRGFLGARAAHKGTEV